MSRPCKMFSACVEWFNDWTHTMDQPIVDEYDLAAWMEEEGCEAIGFFLKTAFRKSKTRAEALDVLRALVWEWFLEQRRCHIRLLQAKPEAVERLRALPQTAQKTAAWYAESRDLLTGHEFAAVATGTPTAFHAAVARKCCAEVVLDTAVDAAIESRTVYATPVDGRLTPFQWGWRYEPVIRDLYELLFAGGRVEDTLGRIRHPTLPRLAASPDGLICEGPKAGRLLEIKAPSTRELTGVVPDEYYCQMQLQAEVADVDAVEYIEVRFDTLTADQTKTWTPTNNNRSIPQRCGAVLVLSPGAEAPPESWTYAYSPIEECTPEGFAKIAAWLPDTFNEETVVVERSMWVIRDLWTTTVPRNRRWWAEVGQPAYERFWVAVDKARQAGTYASNCMILDDEEGEETDILEMKKGHKEDVGHGCMILDSDKESLSSLNEHDQDL